MPAAASSGIGGGGYARGRVSSFGRVRHHPRLHLSSSKWMASAGAQVGTKSGTKRVRSWDQEPD
jgi:hypothetical protein